MPRARDLGIAIGTLPTGPTNSVLDVEGVGLGHVTITRETARTGRDLPAPRRGRLPAAAGRRRRGAQRARATAPGFLSLQESGLFESPVYLTSTSQLGRVYDAAFELELGRHPEVVDDIFVPVVAECDDSFLNDCRTDVGDPRRRPRGPRGGARLARLGGAAGGGGGRLRDRDVVPGVQGRHRYVVAGDTRRPHRRGAADDQLRRARAADRRRRPGRPAAAGARRPRPKPAGLLHRRRRHRRAGRPARLRAAGPPGRAGPGPHRLDRLPRQRRDLPGREHDRPHRPGRRRARRRPAARQARAGRPVRGGRRRRRGGGPQLAADVADDGRPGRQQRPRGSTPTPSYACCGSTAPRDGH